MVVQTKRGQTMRDYKKDAREALKAYRLKRDIKKKAEERFLYKLFDAKNQSDLTKLVEWHLKQNQF